MAYKRPSKQTAKPQRKRRKLRLHGEDRALMYIARDIRRRWCQYGQNRKQAKQFETCQLCGIQPAEEIDHIEPVGSRPRDFTGLGLYMQRMFRLPCQALCARCHLGKTLSERSRKLKPGSPKQKGELDGQEY
jgi:hypothetical protein